MGASWGHSLQSRAMTLSKPPAHRVISLSAIDKWGRGPGWGGAQLFNPVQCPRDALPINRRLQKWLSLLASVATHFWMLDACLSGWLPNGNKTQRPGERKGTQSWNRCVSTSLVATPSVWKWFSPRVSAGFAALRLFPAPCFYSGNQPGKPGWLFRFNQASIKAKTPAIKANRALSRQPRKF